MPAVDDGHRHAGLKALDPAWQSATSPGDDANISSGHLDAIEAGGRGSTFHYRERLPMAMTEASAIEGVA